MAIELVGTTRLDGWGTSLNVPYSSAAGNLLVVSVSVGNVLTPTDTAGNTWMLAHDTSTIGSTSQRLGQVYYSLNAAAITSITLTHAANQNYVVIVSEWSGVEALRASNMNTGTNTAATAAAQAGDLILSGCFYFQTEGTAPVSYPAGYLGVNTWAKGNNFNGQAYQIVLASGNAGPSWALGSSGAQTVTVWKPSTTEPDYFRWDGSKWAPCELVRL